MKKSYANYEKKEHKAGKDKETKKEMGKEMGKLMKSMKNPKKC